MIVILILTTRRFYNCASSGYRRIDDDDFHQRIFFPLLSLARDRLRFAFNSSHVPHRDRSLCGGMNSDTKGIDGIASDGLQLLPPKMSVGIIFFWHTNVKLKSNFLPFCWLCQVPITIIVVAVITCCLAWLAWRCHHHRVRNFLKHYRQVWIWC